ncbi:hypothetical protein GCM10028794_04930 [Silanimonas algicola]
MRASSRSTTALLARVALLAASLALAACAGASSGNGDAGSGPATPPPDMAVPATDANGRPMVDQPRANAAVPVADAGAPGEVDYSCTTDADCAVKDVGSCCGYSPACVNANSPTFPEQVKAECAKNDMQSICGFRDIAGCVCVEGRCEAGPATSGEAVR